MSGKFSREQNSHEQNSHEQKNELFVVSGDKKRIFIVKITQLNSTSLSLFDKQQVFKKGFNI